MRTIKSPRVRRPVPKAPKTAEATFLERIQRELLPDQLKGFIAINMDSGEFVLGAQPHLAFAAFRARWPNSPMYLCRGDGGPAAKFHGRGP